MVDRRYRIICLKRSEYPTKIVYWRPNMRGYTPAPEGAGLYTAEQLDNCAGDTGDWIVEPVGSWMMTIQKHTLRDWE